MNQTRTAEGATQLRQIALTQCTLLLGGCIPAPRPSRPSEHHICLESMWKVPKLNIELCLVDVVHERGGVKQVLGLPYSRR